MMGWFVDRVWQRYPRWLDGYPRKMEGMDREASLLDMVKDILG